MRTAPRWTAWNVLRCVACADTHAACDAVAAALLIGVAAFALRHPALRQSSTRRQIV
jgi:hypothetical protein